MLLKYCKNKVKTSKQEKKNSLSLCLKPRYNLKIESTKSFYKIVIKKLSSRRRFIRLRFVRHIIDRPDNNSSNNNNNNNDHHLNNNPSFPSIISHCALVSSVLPVKLFAVLFLLRNVAISNHGQ